MALRRLREKEAVNYGELHCGEPIAFGKREIFKKVAKSIKINCIELFEKVFFYQTDGGERIKSDYNKKSERYWNDEIYHQRSAKKSRIMEEMKNVAETYKICESSEMHTSQNISCMSVAEIKLKLANLGVKTKLRNKDKLVDLLSRTQQ